MKRKGKKQGGKEDKSRQKRENNERRRRMRRKRRKRKRKRESRRPGTPEVVRPTTKPAFIRQLLAVAGDIKFKATK